MVRALNTVLSQCLLTGQLLKQRVWIWVLAGSLLYFLGEENLPWECLNSHHSKNTGGTNVHLNEDVANWKLQLTFILTLQLP